MAETAFPVPDALPEVLKGFVREILKEQGRPWTREDILQFGAVYFSDQAAQAVAKGGGADSARDSAEAQINEDELVEMLTQLFLRGDADGNGVLDPREFKKLMQSADLGLSQKEVKLLYTQADINQDGCVEYREFIPAAVSLIGVLRAKEAAAQARAEKQEDARGLAEYFIRGMSAQELEWQMTAAFARADADGNGSLDAKEFQAFLKDLPLNLTKREVNAAMLSADADGDGKISYQEFLPVFHAVMSEVVANEVLAAMTEPSEFHDALVACCMKYDTEGSGFLPIQKVTRALRDADLGLTKFQIASVCSGAETGGKGVDYRTFIRESAAPALLAILNVDEKVQVQRSQAWQQVVASEALSEKVLGLPREDFTRVMGQAFQAADKDQNGHLDLGEFEECIRSTGLDLTDAQVSMLLCEADLNGDGKVQYGEFAEVAFILIYQSMHEAAVAAEMAAFLDDIA